MAETEERSLDNFFAKRDKKKKKERSNRAASAAGAAGAAGGSSAAAGAAGSGAGAGARPADGGTAGAAGFGAATKAVTKVRGRDSGPEPRACAHVPASACVAERPGAGRRADGRGSRPRDVGFSGLAR